VRSIITGTINKQKYMYIPNGCCVAMRKLLANLRLKENDKGNCVLQSVVHSTSSSTLKPLKPYLGK
jgi:hypothetical protein